MLMCADDLLSLQSPTFQNVAAERKCAKLVDHKAEVLQHHVSFLQACDHYAMLYKRIKAHESVLLQFEGAISQMQSLKSNEAIEGALTAR
jgi:hypothetical protein